MSKKTIISVIVASVVLTACNDPKEANKENFAKAVQELLTVDNESAVCLSSPRSIYVGSNSLPNDAVFILKQDDKEQQAQATFFLNEGLVSKESKEVEERGMLGKRKVNADIYSVTEKGKQFLRRKEGFFSGAKFCAGKEQLDQIGTFTEPSEYGGMKVSTVNFTVKFTDIPDWVEKAKSIQNFKNDFYNMNKTTRRTDLVLTNEGWKSYKLLK